MDSGSMSMEAIITQLGDLKAACAKFAAADGADPVWRELAAACEAAVSILFALSEEGVASAEDVHNLFFDYHAQVKQCRNLHRRYEVAEEPVHKDGIWHCPQCNSRAKLHHSFCHCCGKRLMWR